MHGRITTLYVSFTVLYCIVLYYKVFLLPVKLTGHYNHNSVFSVSQQKNVFYRGTNTNWSSTRRSQLCCHLHLPLLEEDRDGLALLHCHIGFFRDSVTEAKTGIWAGESSAGAGAECSGWRSGGFIPDTLVRFFSILFA